MLPVLKNDEEPTVRKLVLAFIMASLALSGSACASGDNVPANATQTQTTAKNYWEELATKWVGTDPLERKPGNAMEEPPRAAFWDDPAVAKAMKDTMGEGRFERLVTGWGDPSPVVTSITRIENYLAFFAVRKHDGDYLATVFLSQDDGAVQVCWQEGLSSLWLGPGRSVRSVPPKVCEEDAALLIKAYDLKKTDVLRP